MGRTHPVAESTRGRSGDHRRSGPAWPGPRISLADLDDVLCGRALLTLHDVELHALALGERLEALACDGRVMNEAVLLAVLRRNEAEALRIIEPLHGTGGTHVPTPLGLWCSESGITVRTEHSVRG